MSRLLAQLLENDTPQYHLWLRNMERSAGMPGEDIRLGLKIADEVRVKMRELHLDPKDTTGAEFYSALKMRLMADENRVHTALGIDGQNPLEICEKVTKFMNKSDQTGEVIVIKPAVLKRILKKLKPKSTMKLLGYRSQDSMLKHESVAELLAATFVAESADWHKKRLAEYKKLTPSNFETKKMQFAVPKGKKWPKFAEDYTTKFKQNIISVQEMGTIVVLPLHVQLPALAITTIALCVHAMNDLRAENTYLKLHQVRPDFGEIVASMSDKEWASVASLQGRELTWRTLHWFYGSRHNVNYRQELFEPHVQQEDLWLTETEEILLKLDPEMGFWRNSHFLGMIDSKKPVSMNVLDIALSVCNARNYSRRFAHHMQRSLHREIVGHYLAFSSIHAVASQSLRERLEPELSID